MSKSTFKKNNIEVPFFEPNLTTVILLMVIFIPLIYTITTNLQPPPPPPVITKALITPQTVNTNTISAIESVLKAATDNPSFETYLNLGMAYYNTAKYPQSIKAWEKAIEYNAQSDLAYNNIAAAYGAMNRWEDEIEACKKALAISPNLDLAKRNKKWAESMKNRK